MNELIIALVIYFVLCYYLLNEEEMPIKQETTKQNFLELAKAKLIRHRKEIEFDYYVIADTLEQDLSKFHPYLEDVDFTITEFSVIAAWNRGIISSAEAHNQFKKFDIADAAKNKITSKLQKLLEDVKDEEIKILLSNANNRMLNEVVPTYVKYLNSFKILVGYLRRIDDAQVKLIHGRTVDGRIHQVREVTLNQAIRFIAMNKLYKRDDRYLMCGHVVTFENKAMVDSIVRPTDVDWFLAPNEYNKVLCHLFEVTSKTVLSDQIDFYNKLEKTIKELRKV
jgi:hypothetical protein